MDPITIAAGAMAVGTLAQLYTAEQARGASQERLNEIEKLFNQIKPPNYDLSISAPPEMHDQKLKTPEFSDPANAPQFNLTELKPEDRELVGQYVPQLSAYIQEVAPTKITKTADMKTGRDAQLAALKRLQEVGSSSFDPQYQEAVQKAARAAQGEAQSRQASIMQDFARRGISGSGMNLASQMASSAQSMDRNAAINQSAASDAYRNRLNALMSGANLGGQISQEDRTLQGQNAAIINAFNQRTAANRQSYENQNVNSLNSAQQYNLGNQQRIAEANVAARNAMSQTERNRLDDIARYQAGFAQGERDRVDQNTMWDYGRQSDERKYLNSLAAGKAAWQVGEKEKLNNMYSKQFQDKMDIARGKSGIASSRNDYDMSAAASRNQAIQGLSNAGMAWGMYDQSQKNRDARDDRYFNNLESSINWDD